MISGVTSIIFLASLGVIVFLFILRLFEVQLRFNTFGKLDPAVQKMVTKTSVITLRYSIYIKEFLLVHVYRVSSDTTKAFLKRSKEKRESLLNTLGGVTPRPQEKDSEENVSPFLKEISRIDRKEE